MAITTGDSRLTISPDFVNRVRPGAKRVSFQFAANGTKRAGVLYITTTVIGEPEHPRNIRKAAAMARMRAGAEVVTLHAIVAPMR